MKSDRRNELDQHIDSLLEGAINELRRTVVPPYPALDRQFTALTQSPSRSKPHSWPATVTATILLLAGWSVWRTENVQELATSIDSTPPSILSPVGLVSRSEIRQVTAGVNRPNDALAELDRLQFKITQLVIEIQQVKIRGRAKEICDELHRMVAENR